MYFNRGSPWIYGPAVLLSQRHCGINNAMFALRPLRRLSARQVGRRRYRQIHGHLSLVLVGVHHSVDLHGELSATEVSTRGRHSQRV